MVTNIFGGTMHTIQSVGWQNLKQARSIKIIQTIRSLGSHTIEVNPYEGIIAELQVVVSKT